MRDCDYRIDGRKCHAGTQAFSLIEVLGAVAIIALLGALLVSSFQRVRDVASRTVCLSNLRQLASASLQYAQDHAGTLPYTQWNANPDLNKRWMHEVAPYVNQGLPQGEELFATAVFRCPKGAAFKQFGRMRTYLGWDYVDYSPVGLFAESIDTVDMPVRLHRIPRVSTVAMMVESNNAGHAALWPGWTWDNIMKTSIAGTVPPIARHKDGMNIAYCDGHVALVREPTWNSLGMFPE